MYRIINDQQFHAGRRPRPLRVLGWVSLGMVLGMASAAHAPRLSPVPLADAAMPALPALPSAYQRAEDDHHCPRAGAGGLRLSCSLTH
ncbi:hypothetical protein JN531_008335 [Flagellatimonas centrodinii]|uniref:hypothetical protein n=1 Tax=Flagellatimonas centrodinii TaxID=2806210 RepID=UPI001FEFE7EF|nr:hypothetical protein [Flagellatimonas centrodinii]ULQ45134.1 hypothetical protein JN531_008335 [Flagellatimonas centrodinii]